MSSSRMLSDSDSTLVLLALIAGLRLLVRRKWLLAGSALTAALATAAVVFFLVDPTYRATATLLIESKLPTVVEITEVTGRSSGDRTYFQTQIETIRSRPVIERVVDRLALDTHPAYDPRQEAPSWWAEWLDTHGFVSGRDERHPPAPK